MEIIQPVASWSFDPFFHSTKETIANKFEFVLPHFLGCAKESIESFEKHYSRPIIYTDTLGKEVFSRLTDKCDIECVYDGLYDGEVSNHFWAYGKILTYQAQKKPYLHFDLDFIVSKNLQREDDEVIVVQNDEKVNPSTDTDNWYAYMNEGIKHDYVLPEIFYKYNIENIKAMNTGYFSITDMGFSAEFAAEAIKLFKDNMCNVKKATNNLLLPLTGDQQLLGLMIKDKGMKYSTLKFEIDTTINPNFQHYLGFLKESPRAQRRLNKMVTPLVTEICNDLAQRTI